MDELAVKFNSNFRPSRLKAMCTDFNWLIYWHANIYSTASLYFVIRGYIYLIAKSNIIFKEMKDIFSNTFCMDIIEMS